MKSRFEVKYRTDNNASETKQYLKLMKIVGKAIKDNKEVIFDYADNLVTVTIND